jgi:hypothetical protein
MQSNNFNQQVMQPPTNFDIEVLSVNEGVDFPPHFMV